MTIDELRAEIENKRRERVEYIEEKKKLSSPVFIHINSEIRTLEWVLSLIEKGE